MKNKIIVVSLFLALFFVGIQVTHATSGACSSHSGVSCSSGMDIDGSVVCKDGTRESSVPYDFMIMCKDQKQLEISNYCNGLRSQFEYYIKSKDQYLKEIDAKIDQQQSTLLKRDMGNPAIADSYYKYLDYLNTLRDRQTERYASAVQTSISSCKVDKLNEWYSKLKSVVIPIKTDDQVCQDIYGTNTYGDSQYCYCNEGYEWNSSKTSCISNLTCPLNSTRIGNICSCNEGHVKRDTRCLSYTDDCSLTYGYYIVGSRGPDNNSLCDCPSGYIWNDSKTKCTEEIISITESVNNFVVKPITQEKPIMEEKRLEVEEIKKEVKKDVFNNTNLASVNSAKQIATSTEKVKHKSLWVRIKSWLGFWN